MPRLTHFQLEDRLHTATIQALSELELRGVVEIGSGENSDSEFGYKVFEAAFHQPDSFPITWHRSALECDPLAGIVPTARTFHVIQGVAAALQSELKLLAQKQIL